MCEVLCCCCCCCCLRGVLGGGGKSSAGPAPALDFSRSMPIQSSEPLLPPAPPALLLLLLSLLLFCCEISSSSFFPLRGDFDRLLRATPLLQDLLGDVCFALASDPSDAVGYVAVLSLGVVLALPDGTSRNNLRCYDDVTVRCYDDATVITVL